MRESEVLYQLIDVRSHGEEPCGIIENTSRVWRWSYSQAEEPGPVDEWNNVRLIAKRFRHNAYVQQKSALGKCLVMYAEKYA